MSTRWEIKKLGEVCSIINGGTPDTKIKEFWDGNNLWITPKDMGQLNSVFVEHTERRITDAGLKNSSAKMLPPYSVILSSRAPIGHLAINTKPISTNQGCKGIIPSEKINTLFLYYFLKSSVELLNDLGTGTTFKELSGSKLFDVEIPVPPLNEQQQIVTILEKAFAAIAKSKANAEQNLKNAKDLFESYLRGVFSGGVLNSTIGEQFILQRGFDITKGQQENGTVPVVSSGGIKSYHNKAMVKSPGVVIGRKGTLGKVFYLSEDFWPHDTTLWVKDFKGNTPKFVYYFLKSLDVSSLDSGAANPALNRNQVHPIKVNWHPLKSQEEIVVKLDSILHKTQKLESIYQQKIDALEDVKKSILQKAFAGELTTEKAVAV